MSDPVSQLSRSLGEAIGAPITLERPGDPTHGDYATTVALQLAGRLRRPPREIAEELALSARELAHVASASVAGPGFVNLELTDAWFAEALASVLAAGDRFGGDSASTSERVQVEMVSANPTGPITVVTGKSKRITLIECPNDTAAMLDCAKIADLVLLCVDAKFGFEMETFEFLNVLQTHGFPKVMGIFTHLDLFRTAKNLRKTKKLLKHRFWTEIYEGAKMFYFSGVINGKYLKNEVKQLTLFISRVKVSHH